ncbi:MAG: UDP-N-acetylglucosamine 1-carboxyvinyltransferase [Alphaproteobacteria bacterium]|nr:UDP-N-acetylglucosamine 1-carboxyvinyltransferase [Alphaproteobacteria bacterium]NCQ66642.1 UDP-N-acetylglucosamine 1-carboxyvinyltransferase [Alphaproteobacteria bacterium]NCT06994.1 UDP-N-acetylglucosamine 1-carboxyvinyltransferase [Alphaproteobacteria bacterium]
MDKIRITGSISPKPLKGKIKISGAKNATLPLMAASLLTDQPIKFTNCPRLADVFTLETLLNHHGVESTFAGNTMTLTASSIKDHCAPYDLVRKMRASVLVLGPILAREGHAEVSLPGGCAIGTRPVDLHLMGLEKMGASIEIDQGYIKAKAPKNGLQGAEIAFPTISVGATENILMAATLANGTTKLINAACEPEITDLANCLIKMGAKIQGIGTGTLVIEGVKKLSGAIHPIVADRIETGSYAIAAAMTGGELELVGTSLDLLPTFKEILEATGTTFIPVENGFIVRAPEGPVKSVDMNTAPFPGYPTDLQAQFMALMTLADGSSNITETIFENRFMHVPELARMGADITLSGRTATVRGVSRLKGAEVMATDLRASVSLIMAGLCAEGETNVGRIYHLDRGYEDIENKLKACGGNIRRYRDGDTVKNDGGAKENTG